MTMARIALTAGEPAGIGADLCVQLAQQNVDYQLIIIADPHLLLQRAAQLKLPLIIDIFNPQLPAIKHRAGRLNVLPVNLNAPVQAGQLNPANSDYVLKILTLATQGCMQGLFSAMVTAPVHKAVINEAGFEFTGHTEFIAHITGGYPVMMLVTEGLRVALVTTHLPLIDVSAAINKQTLEKVIRVLQHDLKTRFQCANPRIIVCGLNPHAGESGHLGKEEITVINPVIAALKAQGFNLLGALPADTVFTPKYLESADAVLAMYHDQGLPVLKYKGFGKAANITLGLPIIRTSVDHGTALDLAGTGLAECGSLHYALQTALTMLN